MSLDTAPNPAAAASGGSAPAFLLPALHAPEPLGAGTRRLLVGGMVGAHLLAGWALLQIEPVRQALVDVLPIQVDLIAPTPRTLPPPPPPAPRLRTPPPPPAAVIAAAPPPLPQSPPAYEAPPTPPEPPAPAPPAPPQPAEKAPPAPPAPVLAPAPAPAAPRKVTLSDTDWIRPPAYAYPREALRRRESGTVIVRIRFDTQGLPAQVTLQRSSGSAALDEEALAKARAARAKPRLMDGVPIEFLADSVAEFKF